MQCGFCTSGMLIAARDIVRRLPGADEQRIRVELSGNLCRCTGYLGIVNAVRERDRGARLDDRLPAGVGAEPRRLPRASATFVAERIEARVTPPPAPATRSARKAAQGLDAVRGELRDRRAAGDGVAGVRGRSSRRGLSCPGAELTEL